jgi:hypothetical protein
MKYAGLFVVGVLLSCGGCVVRQPVPIAAPATAVAPAPAAQNCREFQDTVTVDGTQQRAVGTTCQQPDGSWRIAGPQAATPSPTAAAAIPYPPAYPVYSYYPYYGYPAFYGPSVALGFRFGGRFR